MTLSSLQVHTLGNKETGFNVLLKLYRDSSAYRKLIQEKLGITAEEDLKSLQWTDLPILNKENFYGIHAWEDMMSVEASQNVYLLLQSGGTTNVGHKKGGFFWPKLKKQFGFELKVQEFVAEIFQLAKKRTLVIIGLSFGSWGGAQTLSFMFQTLALTTDFAITVVNPGNQYPEIIEIIQLMQDKFDQIIITLCPAAIFYVQQFAAQQDFTLPYDKLSFLAIGEPFSEQLRLGLEKQMSQLREVPAIFSVYSATDAGLLGFESKPLIRLRQFLTQNSSVATKLGFVSSTVPNLFHVPTRDLYVEDVGGEMLITRAQALSLVRYNIEDKIKFFSWQGLCEVIAKEDKEKSKMWLSFAGLPLPDVIALSGRTKGCLFLCGTNIFESMLQEALLKSSLREKITGIFVVWTELIEGRQVLAWQIELKSGYKAPSADELKLIHAELVNYLAEEQPEFAGDYEKVYRPFENEGLMIFKLHFCAAPTLSGPLSASTAIKRKVIIDSGPI